MQAKSYKEETKTVTKNFNETNAICKMENFYHLFAFLLITTILLLPVSIYCYLIKYQVNQRHLLPFHVTNDKLIINVLQIRIVMMN